MRVLTAALPPAVPVRLVACLALLVVSAGCTADAPDAAVPDTEGNRLLAAVVASAVAPAFERARRSRADVTVSVYDAHVVAGRETATVIQDGDSVRVTDRTASGMLAGDLASTPRLTDPIAPALPQDPPYLDPSVRDAYRVTVLGDTVIAGARFRRVQAVLTDETRELGVRRVWAAVDSNGRIGAIEVDRRSDSAIYDETSRVRVDLAPGPGGWVPRRVTTDTRTDVPLSDPAHVRTVWTVREVDGQPIWRDGR